MCACRGQQYSARLYWMQLQHLIVSAQHEHVPCVSSTWHRPQEGNRQCTAPLMLSDWQPSWHSNTMSSCGIAREDGVVACRMACVACNQSGIQMGTTHKAVSILGDHRQLFNWIIV
jgi:hypothetical protein